MVLSTCTINIFNCFGYEQGIEKAAQAGFDALDFSMYRNFDSNDFFGKHYESNAIKLKSTAEKNGIYFNQAHAPHPSYKFDDEGYNKVIYPKLVRAIKIAGILGAKQIVIHPTAIYSEPEQMKFNIDFYNSLTPYCKEYNIKIALENMWGRNKATGKIAPNVCSLGHQLAMYYDNLDPKYFTVCLDIGHTILVGQNPADAIKQLGGKRLGALHVHDNDGIKDWHTIPYQGIIKWDEITKALKEINYSGDFTYEVSGSFIAQYEDKPEIMIKALELLAATGRSLIDKIENSKEC